jgi:putative SOS response-associated peptidase YedK
MPERDTSHHPLTDLLVASWSKDRSIGYKTINARTETVATTASFREPFKSQRCLVPADGFYEWKREG